MIATRRQRRSDATRHLDALRTSSFLTQTFRRMYQRDAAVIIPEEVIEVLNRAGVEFVLLGTHGVGGWRSEPRATQDVDFLIRTKNHRKAVKAVRDAYPQLQINDLLVVTRFVDPATGQGVIDLMKPLEPLYAAAFKNTIAVGNHRIPNLELALAVKFAALISPDRLEKKRHVDIGDFIDIAEHNRDRINHSRLEKLGERIHEGGGADLLYYVAEVAAGRVVDWAALVKRKELLT